jgi:hypothetical protein
VHLRRVLDHDQLERGHVEAQLFAGPGTVFQQPCFIFGMSPRVGHDSRATLGRAVAHVLDRIGDLPLGDQALLHQQLAQAHLHQLEVSQRLVLALIFHAGSSQC